MKLTIESSVLEQPRPSGVNYLTSGLVKSLSEIKNSNLQMSFLWMNFLGAKKSIYKYPQSSSLQVVRLIPQRVYAKLVKYKIAPPIVVKKSDWILFPNFYIWPTISRAKKAVIIHDLCYLRYPEYVEEKNQRFLKQVATRSIKKADLIIVDSEFIANEIVELTNTSIEKIHVLGVPVDTADFSNSLDKGGTHLAKRYNINKKYILSFGTLEPRKNLECLVKAYCKLNKSIRQEYSLVLAGKWGWKIESLKELIEQKQSEGYDIITPGYIDHGDRATFYRNADFYAITTHYEGFGMPLLEALHCGIPTVAVDIPVLREVGGEACLWAKKSADDVNLKLTKLINDPKLAKKLAKLGPEQSKKYSWDKSAKSLLARLAIIPTYIK